jgi:hypothetical protein
VDVEAVAVGSLEVLGHVQNRVEPEQVHQHERAHRRHVGRRHALVDLLDREALLLLLAPDLADRGVEDAVDHEAGHLATGDRLLADRLGEVDRRLDGVVGGVVALHDLDQREHRGRVEVVEAHDLLRADRGLADLGDRQRAGVGGEDRVAGRDRVELAEDALLDLHLLGHGLDHEVHVTETVVARGAGDPAHYLVDLCVGLFLGDLLLLHQAAHLAGGHVARLVEPVVDEVLVDVLEHDLDAGRGDRLGDLAAHGACAHDGGFEYEQVCLRFWL